jgi:hypothetical protein
MRLQKGINFLGNVLLLSFFLILAVNFSMLWLHGGVYFIYEHNKAILIFETVMTAGIGIIAVERVVTMLRKGGV